MDPYSAYSWYRLQFFLQRRYALLKSICDTYRQMSFRAFSLCLINLSLSILFPRPFIYSFGWRNIFPALFLLCFLHTSPQTLYLSIWWKEYFLPALFLFFVPLLYSSDHLTDLFSCSFILFFRDSVIIWFSFYFRCFVCSSTLNGVKEYEEGLLLFNFTHFASFYG